MNILKEALKIHELEESLKRIAQDDKKEVAAYTDKEIIDEAKYVLSLFLDGGCSLNEMLNGEDGEEDQKFAEKQVKQLRKLIASYRG